MMEGVGVVLDVAVSWVDGGGISTVFEEVMRYVKFIHRFATAERFRFKWPPG